MVLCLVLGLNSLINHYGIMNLTTFLRNDKYVLDFAYIKSNTFNKINNKFINKQVKRLAKEIPVNIYKDKIGLFD